MTTFRGGSYNTGISEQAVVQKATEDGRAGILDPGAVGKANSYPHALDHLTEGHDAATGCIGHDLRDEIYGIDEQLATEHGSVEQTRADALRAIGERKSATKRQLVQRQRMFAAGLPLPSPRDTLVQLLLLLLLFVGDWGLIALGYQIMGLSDRPWISFLGFTDDLHLAALSSVAALVFLGDFVGGHLRRIEHAFELRRQAGKEHRDGFPMPAIFDYVWTAVCLSGALAGLFALSGIRAEYLAAMGVGANYWAFMGIQAVILGAAIGLGFAHANPEAKKWRSVAADVRTAEATCDSAVTAHVESVGRFNAGVDRRDAVIAKAGHHVDVDAANVRGQQSEYRRSYLKAQLEPAQEQLFVPHKTVHEYGEGELLTRLTGIKPFPVRTRADTDTVVTVLGECRVEIEVLRARIDQIEINKLDLPELEESGSGPAAESGAGTDSVEEPENPAATATPLRRVPATRADVEGDVGEAAEEPA